MEEKKELYRKKGQMLNGSVSAIIVLVIGVGVAVLILIFVGTLGGQTYELVEDDIDAIANNVITEEAFTAINSTSVQLNHGFIQTGTLTIQNSTANSGTALSLSNFTIDYDAGTVILKPAADITLNNTDMLANYTWGAIDVRYSIKNGIVNSFEALEQTGDYLPIIVLAIVIAIVLTLVLGYMTFGGGGRINGSAL